METNQRPTPETDAFFTAYNLRAEGNIGEFARRLEQQRDELLEALKDAMEHIPTTMQCRARTAIANVGQP